MSASRQRGTDMAQVLHSSSIRWWWTPRVGEHQENMLTEHGLSIAGKRIAEEVVRRTGFL